MDVTNFSKKLRVIRKRDFTSIGYHLTAGHTFSFVRIFSVIILQKLHLFPSSNLPSNLSYKDVAILHPEMESSELRFFEL